MNIITYYSPRIFETLGVSGTSLKLFSTGFYGIAKTLGMCAFTFIVVERVGRRKGLVWGAALGCIPIWYSEFVLVLLVLRSCGTVGAYCKIVDPAAAAAAGQTQQTGWGYLAMVCVSCPASMS